MTITEFLEARLAEDEAAARDATLGPWEVVPMGDQPRVQQVGHDAWLALTSSDPGAPKDANARHMARHSSTRVLAECAAKRAILEAHPTQIYSGIKGQEVMECQNCERFPCDTLKALASVYADHPDYSQEWA